MRRVCIRKSRPHDQINARYCVGLRSPRATHIRRRTTCEVHSGGVGAGGGAGGRNKKAHFPAPYFAGGTGEAAVEGEAQSIVARWWQLGPIVICPSRAIGWAKYQKNPAERFAMRPYGRCTPCSFTTRRWGTLPFVQAPQKCRQ